MFSTYDGAKKRAKLLKRQLEASGFDYPLNKCQNAVANAGGYRDWHDLTSSLYGREARFLEPDVYSRRLIRALPVPCTATVTAMLDSEPLAAAVDDGTPPRWWQDVFPYVFAIAVLHRSRTDIIRPGSGAGQRLRENLVCGLLLNRHGGQAALPRLDPESLVLIYAGDPESLFRADSRHPRFEIELETLVQADIIKVLPNEVRISPPDPDAVKSHVLSGWIGKAAHRTESGGKAAAEALRDALAAIGVREALRIADAIVQYGSDAFNQPAGPALELLSSLADEGAIDTFAKAVHIFEAIYPKSARSIRQSIPAKISSRYWARHRKLDTGRLLAYGNANPDWAKRLRDAAADPSRFILTVENMAAEIEAS